MPLPSSSVQRSHFMRKDFTVVRGQICSRERASWEQSEKFNGSPVNQWQLQDCVRKQSRQSNPDEKKARINDRYLRAFCVSLRLAVNYSAFMLLEIFSNVSLSGI